MRSSLRTRGPAILVALAAGGLAACGYLGVDFLPEDGNGAGDGAAADGSTDGSGSDDATGGGDATDAGVDAGRCTGPNCPGVIYVSTGIGDDQNPGTAEMPVRTITGGLTLAKTDPAKRNQLYVAGGDYHENVDLVEKVGIIGGFACSQMPCTWDWNIKANVTKIIDQRPTGMSALHDITRATVLEGLAVVAQTGAAMGTRSSAMTLDGASPTIRNCAIFSGVGNPESIAITMTATVPQSDSSGPLVIASAVEGSNSPDKSRAIFIDATGGNALKATIQNCDVHSGSGTTTYGILAQGNYDLTVSDNRIRSGAAASTGNEPESWGLWLGAGGTALLARNRINFDVAVGTAASTASCVSTLYWCGGVQLYGGTARLESNAIVGATAPKSAAVLLVKADSTTPDMVLNANTLEGEGQSGDVGTYFSAAIALRRDDSDGAATFGKAVNNILAHGRGQGHYGIFESQTASRAAHLGVLDNNLFMLAPAAGTNEAAYAYWSGSAATYYQFDQLDSLPINPQANQIGAPGYTMFPHIATSSVAVDKGTTSNGAPQLDIDVEKRPKGGAMDIGADEVK